MAAVTLENIKKLDRGVSKLFAKVWDEVKKDKRFYQLIATESKSKNRSVNYAWIGDLPMMKEWVGERQLAQLKDHTYEIVKKDWETSFSVHRDDIYFDELGLVKAKVNALVEAVFDHYDHLVSSLIKTNGVCYDGKKFFDTHEVGEGNTKATYINKSNFTFNKDNVFAVVGKMEAIKREDGQTPFGIKPSLVLVAPDLRQAAAKVFGASVSDSSSNEAKGLLEYQICPYLDAGTWCVLDTSRSLKPFILQIIKEAKSPERDEGDLFKAKQIHYGIDTMDNAGYGLWQQAHFCDGTESTATRSSNDAREEATLEAVLKEKAKLEAELKAAKSAKTKAENQAKALAEEKAALEAESNADSKADTKAK